MGHSYICYAPLLHGCTTVLYEGKPVGTPDAGAFWRVVEPVCVWWCVVCVKWCFMYELRNVLHVL